MARGAGPRDSPCRVVRRGVVVVRFTRAYCGEDGYASCECGANGGSNLSSMFFVGFVYFFRVALLGCAKVKVVRGFVSGGISCRVVAKVTRRD